MKELLLECNHKGHIKNRESECLEFKESFHRPGSESFTKTSRTIAGYANGNGGYVVYGVENSPRVPIGVDSRWRDLDPKDITTFLQNHYYPEINFELDDFTIIVNSQEMTLGVIRIYESTYKPVICKKIDSKNILRLNAIYKRDRGKTDEIKPEDLIFLLNREREKEKEKWLNLFEKIGKVGLDNIALLNLQDGEIKGHNGNFYIDENLLPSLKFINEGHFDEKEGAPTLKLIGTLEKVAVQIEKPVPYPVVNPNLLKPKQVVTMVQQHFQANNVPVNFTQDAHTRCFKKYNVRPPKGSENPGETNALYCLYDVLNENYGYTQEWVEFLSVTMSDEQEFWSLYPNR